ncbi:hypothetical protein IQ250_07370 [Pseudanabaenaceae cyanobacterium LEGE 13415]|nr:hypothetical protein [Pseudanabaenaceae cyanobacterium LEGE 13415]
MASINLGEVLFSAKIDYSQIDKDLKRIENKIKSRPLVYGVTVDTKSFLKQLDQTERAFEKAGQRHATAYNRGFASRLGIADAIMKKLDSINKRAESVGTRSGRSYSTAFNRAAAVAPQINTSGSAAAGSAAGRVFGSNFAGSAQSSVGTGSRSIFGGLANGSLGIARSIGSTFGNTFLSVGRAVVGTGTSIFSALIGSATSIGTTLGRGITSGVAGAISVGGGIISNAFTGIVAGVSSSITSAIGSGIRDSLDFIKDSYIGILKAGFREAFSDAKKSAELDLISAQSGRLAYENIAASQRSGLSPEQFQRDFKASALAAGSDPGLELSNRQALLIGSQLARQGFGKLSASSITPIGRLSSVLGEDPGKTAELVGSSAAPFNLKTQADMNRFVNQISVAATVTRSTIQDINTSLKYYRENVSGTEGSDTVLRLLSRLGAVGITGSSGSIVAGQISQRKVAIGNVVGVGTNQLANLNTSESIDVLLSAYKKRLSELGEGTVDALNFTNAFKKATGERGAAILKLLSEDDASRERINQRFDKIAKGQDDLKSQADALVKRASKQFDVLASSVETLQSGRIGESSLNVFAGFARMATTAIGEIIKIRDWEPLIKAGEKFYSLILKITDNAKPFQPIASFVAGVIRDITGTVNELTRQLGTERGVSALVNRIVGGLEIGYSFVKGITRALLTLVGGESTINDFFDPKLAEDFRKSAVQIGKTIENNIVKGASFLRDIFASVPKILQTWVPVLSGITKLVGGIGNFFRGTNDRVRTLPENLPKFNYTNSTGGAEIPPGFLDQRGTGLDVVTDRLGRPPEQTSGDFIRQKFDEAYKLGFWGLIDKLVAALEPLTNALQPLFQSIVDFGAQTLPPLLKSLPDLIRGGAAIGRIVVDGATLIAKVVVPLAEYLLPKVVPLLESVANQFGKLVSGFGFGIVDDPKSTNTTIFGELGLGTDTQQQVNLTFGGIRNAFSDFTTFLAASNTGLQGDLSKIQANLTSFFGDIQRTGNVFTQWFQNLKSQNVFTGFTEGFRSTDTNTNNSKIATVANKSLNTGLADIFLKGNVEASGLAESIGRAVSTLSPDLLVTAGKFAQIGGAIFRSLLSTSRIIVDVLTPALKFLLPFVNAGLDLIANILGGIANVNAYVADKIHIVSEAFTVGLKPILDQMSINLPNMFSGLFGGLIKFVTDDAPKQIGGFFTWFLEGYNNMWNSAGTILSNFWNGFTTTLTNVGTSIWKGITGAFSSIGNWLFGGAASAAEVPALQAGQTAGSSLATGVETGASNAGGSWMQQMTDSFFTSIQSIGGYFTGMFAGVRNAIAWIANQSIPFLQTAWKAYYEAISGFWTGVFNGIRSGIGWLVSNSLPFLQKAATGMLSIARQ